MSKYPSLFSPLQIGAIDVQNRVLMAPLTRSRASDNGVPSPMAATYYRQRASAGLIISEATQVSPMGKGYDNTPGIYNQAQVAAWKEVTDAVHAAGGKIFLQLWHVGRISFRSLLPGGQAPLAPSAIRARVKTFVNGTFTDVDAPRALATNEVAEIIGQFADGARCAKAAGFDGVEIHAANGYLPEQFLLSGTNQRTDQYGGDAVNRARFLLEITRAAIDVWGSERVGVRLSPTSTYNDVEDINRLETFSEVYRALDALQLAYLHVVEPAPGAPASELKLIEQLRPLWTGTYIANGGFDAARASAWIDSGHAHAITFGKAFIANPDLPARISTDASLNTPDPDSFYGGDARGYIDYPSL
ncbi:alkene reductase [Microbulbifer hainanensis]|uniref:alkene reductase n=1 Tax=Microbulbifer hainanensis TaxID=2735675 RepID=UPI001868C407|nr:alkene reductase [Microbulbifer hainanensis]